MIIPEISQIVEAEIKPGGPGAAIAVIKGGELIHANGYGLANVEWEIPITPDTVFRLASVTKQFTATAIMMLAEQGKLSVDDPITRFLPQYPTSGHDITIHHLLNHTSGIFSYTNAPDFLKTARRDMTLEELMAEYSRVPFDFRPGAKYSYNNSGYLLLGMIIEKASGMSYEDYIKNCIFAPLGMTQSYYLHNEPIIPKRASGYEPAPDGSLRNATFLSMTQPHAAGSLGSTVLDLAKWDKALRENTLIRAETLKQMYTPGKLDDGSTIDYGYGWGLGKYRDMYPVAQHSGGIFGFNAFIARFYEHGLTVIVLANVVGFPYEQITAAIARHMLGIQIPERTPVTLSSEEFERVVGGYQFSGMPIPVTREGDGIVLGIPGQPRQMLPLSATEFYDAQDPESVLTFQNEVDGKYSQIDYKRAFQRLKLERTPETPAQA
jgi:CubicO group peptidase (beta-lactamase class C family)